MCSFLCFVCNINWLIFRIVIWLIVIIVKGFMLCGIIVVVGIVVAKGVVIVGTVGTCGLVAGLCMRVGALLGVMS